MALFGSKKVRHPPLRIPTPPLYPPLSVPPTAAPISPTGAIYSAGAPSPSTIYSAGSAMPTTVSSGYWYTPYSAKGGWEYTVTGELVYRGTVETAGTSFKFDMKPTISDDDLDRLCSEIVLRNVDE